MTKESSEELRFSDLKGWMTGRLPPDRQAVVDADLAKGERSEIAMLLTTMRDATARIVGPASWKPAEPGTDTLEDVYQWLQKNKGDDTRGHAERQQRRRRPETDQEANRDR
jgi:hypothetical protein